MVKAFDRKAGEPLLDDAGIDPIPSWRERRAQKVGEESSAKLGVSARSDGLEVGQVLAEETERLKETQTGGWQVSGVCRLNHQGSDEVVSDEETIDLLENADGSVTAQRSFGKLMGFDLVGRQFVLPACVIGPDDLPGGGVNGVEQGGDQTMFLPDVREAGVIQGVANHANDNPALPAATAGRRINVCQDRAIGQRFQELRTHSSGQTGEDMSAAGAGAGQNRVTVQATIVTQEISRPKGALQALGSGMLVGTIGPDARVEIGMGATLDEANQPRLRPRGDPVTGAGAAEGVVVRGGIGQVEGLRVDGQMPIAEVKGTRCVGGDQGTTDVMEQRNDRTCS